MGNRISQALKSAPNKDEQQTEHADHYSETLHKLNCGDARKLNWIADESVHLVVTSPPYWTLKKYNNHPDQLGDVADYEAFMEELDKVWRECYRALVPGGRIACVVGDVCIARRRNNGRHMVVPLHANIAVRSRASA